MYSDLLNLLKPISFKIKNHYGIMTSESVTGYLKKLELNSWQQKIRYHRLIRNIATDEMAEELGLSSGSVYVKKYETVNTGYHTTVENYMKVCDIIGIAYEDIADEYMLFLVSDYDKKLKQAIELSGLTIKAFAEKYGIDHSIIRYSLKKKHKIKQYTCEKFKRIFEEYGL